MAEILDDIKEPELQLEEGESAGNIIEDNLDEAHHDIADEGEVVPDVSKNSVDPDAESDLPEKFRGKSAAEIAASYRDLEKLMSDQGNELANLRRTFDAMTLNQSKAFEPEPEPVVEADFFSDPTGAVNRAVENHPALKQAQEMAQKMNYAQGLSILQQRHPDLAEVINSAKFGEWIKSSSVRLARYERANIAGDIEEADDLISTFKELNRVEIATQEASRKAQKQAVRSANTGSLRGNSDVQGSRRIYRSADMRELNQNNPKRYEDLENEILRAYAEGRVRD